MVWREIWRKTKRGKISKTEEAMLTKQNLVHMYTLWSFKGQLMQTCNCFCICKEPNYKTNAKPNTKTIYLFVTKTKTKTKTRNNLYFKLKLKLFEWKHQNYN